jgi:hypothetical protein
MDMGVLKISVVLKRVSTLSKVLQMKGVVGQAPHYTPDRIFWYGNLQNELKYEVHKLNQKIIMVRTGYTKSGSNINGVCTYYEK